MNLDLFDRRRAERFAQLLDETNGGLRHHARADDQLAELVAIGHTLSAVRPAVQVDPEFRTGLRAMLVATAERDGMGRTAAIETAPGAHAAIREPRLRSALGKGTGRRVRARGAIVIGVAAGALAVSGISAASENAVPGDVFYGVKRSTERAQLAMAGSDLGRGQLSLDFARTRLAEATALDGGDHAFREVLDDMDNDTRQGIRLLTTSAVARTNSTPLTVIDEFVAGQRRLVVPVLDRLDAANRERAMTSMILLDDIARRVTGLRASFECDRNGTSATDGTDSLGPKPNACWSGSGSTAPGGQKPGHAEEGEEAGAPVNRTPTKAKPSRSGPASDGGSTGEGMQEEEPGTPGTGPGTPRRSVEPPADSGDEPGMDGEPRNDDDDPGLLGGITGILGG